jgi:acyl-CoA synthetase (NDP forming)
VAQALGIQTPAFVAVASAAEVRSADLSRITTEFVVLKAVSPEILHKTEVGGVRVVPNDSEAILEAVQDMERRLSGRGVTFTVNQYVPHSDALGGQLLLGLRWTSDFGPVVAFGPGGVHTEWLAKHLDGGNGVSVLSPALSAPDLVKRALDNSAFLDLVTGRARGGQVHFSRETISDLVGRLLAFAAGDLARQIEEFEINPLVPSPDGPVALDVLVKLRTDTVAPRPARPLHKLHALLEPRSIAIMGVSERENPGRMILRNTLRAGFPPDRVTIVKPNASAIDGVRCVPDLASLPSPIDLLVLSIAAAQVPDTIAEVVASRRAESIIVIPGGLGERSGTCELAARVTTVLDASRSTDWQGPVVNGGNCLGVLSQPGRYDTTFIPEHKVAPRPGKPTPLALISQSGAFAVARLSSLAGLNPRYAISVGNQIDLTVGDYLTYLAADSEIEVFACYLEGLQPLDGSRWLEAARQITAGGRQVLLYRAGRTAAGAQATASHTAAVAGDYAVTRKLAEAAGVVVADSLADFDDLIRLFCYLRGRPVGGWRLGAVSNAGFECVAMVDNLGRFELAPFGAATVHALEAALSRCHLEEIVEARNPVDLTPIANDEVYGEVVRAVLADPSVDVGIVGCVPLTPALQTLATSAAHDENLDDERSMVHRLTRLSTDIAKPWVAVVDGGPLYEPMRTRLQESGVPTFRSADRALRLLELYCRRMSDTW